MSTSAPGRRLILAYRFTRGPAVLLAGLWLAADPGEARKLGELVVLELSEHGPLWVRAGTWLGLHLAPTDVKDAALPRAGPAAAALIPRALASRRRWRRSFALAQEETMIRSAAVLVLLACVSCSSVQEEPTPQGPARVCRSGRGWSAGTPAFVDRTEAWGLAGLGLRSFAVADVDGDGWPDVVSEKPAYERNVGVVYLNRAAPGGGRRLELDTAHPNPLPSRINPALGRYLSIQTAGDVDGDGDVDLFVDEMDYPPSAETPVIADGPDVLLNDGRGGFTLTPEPQILGPERPLATGAFFLDFDLDGNLDLAEGFWWVQPPFTQPFGQQPQLFRGDGHGGFTEVTAQAGLTLQYTNESVVAGTNARPLFAFTGCDVNDDGRLDLVGAAYGRMFNELFVASGDRFTEDARARGVASDPREDYTTDLSYRCYCAANPGPYCEGAQPPPPNVCGAFGGPYLRGWQPGASDQPYNLGGNTFTHVCADVDNDGDMDLYESNIKHPDTGTASDPSELLVNDGTGHFTRPGREGMGLTPPVDLTAIDEGGQQAAVLDFDGDGLQDVYLMGSPYPRNRGWLFHQDAPLRFTYAGDGSGLHHACPSGMALADFDHDGDEDVIVGTYGCNDATTGDWKPPENQPTRFYENVSSEANWLSLRLVGQGAGHASRSAIGARVRVTAGGVTQTRFIHGSWGQGNESRELVAFFGLGAACDVERVEVRWPDAALTTQTFTGVLANHRVELREGDPEPRYLP